MISQVLLYTAVLSVGVLVTTCDKHDADTSPDLDVSFVDDELSSSFVVDRKNVSKDRKIMHSSWTRARESNSQNFSEEIRPERVPWLVKILTDSGFHLFTGALVTWQNVVTTCNAATSVQIKYVTAGFGGKQPHRRNVLATTLDKRCMLKDDTDIMDRYNMGIITVDKPFRANNTLNLIQFPTLNKLKYLELTDQLTARGSTCHFFRWNNDGVLNAVTITAVESYRVPECLEYQGVHEFVCSTNSELDRDDSDTMEGTPIFCGEDVYGILPEIYEQPVLNITKDRYVYIWLRLDEFVHNIFESDPELVNFINDVGY